MNINPLNLPLLFNIDYFCGGGSSCVARGGSDGTTVLSNRTDCVKGLASLLQEDVNEVASSDYNVLTDDGSIKKGLGSLAHVRIVPEKVSETFFEEHPQFEYIWEAMRLNGADIRLVTHPKETSTCQEKADLLGWDISRIIKTVYFVHKDTGKLYALVGPESGPVDLEHISDALGFNAKKKLTLANPDQLPHGMTEGTCTPFIPETTSNIAGIIFDSDLVEQRRKKCGFDDFSIVLDMETVDNRQVSIQISYAKAYDLLRSRFPEITLSLTKDKQKYVLASFEDRNVPYSVVKHSGQVWTPKPDGDSPVVVQGTILSYIDRKEGNREKTIVYFHDASKEIDEYNWPLKKALNIPDRKKTRLFNFNGHTKHLTGLDEDGVSTLFMPKTAGFSGTYLDEDLMGKTCGFYLGNGQSLIAPAEEVYTTLKCTDSASNLHIIKLEK